MTTIVTNSMITKLISFLMGCIKECDSPDEVYYLNTDTINEFLGIKSHTDESIERTGVKSIKTKFKKIESYFDLYIRDDGFLLKFNQSDKYLPDLLMFKGFTPKNIDGANQILIQFNIGRYNAIGYTINGWLHWGDGSNTLASESSWIYRDTIVDIIRKKINWLGPLPKYNDNGGLYNLIKTAATLAKVRVNINKNKKNYNPHIFDMRSKKD